MSRKACTRWTDVPLRSVAHQDKQTNKQTGKKGTIYLWWSNNESTRFMSCFMKTERKGGRVKDDGGGFAWRQSLSLSLSPSLCDLFIYLLLTKIQEDYTPFAACLLDQAAICLRTWAASWEAGFARPSIIICCSLKRATALLPTFCTFSSSSFFSSGGPNSDWAPRSLITIYGRYRGDVVRSERGLWARGLAADALTVNKN